MEEHQRKGNIGVQKIKKWEEELKKNGFIADEAELLVLISKLSAEKHPGELSSLLSLAAASRAGRKGIDPVALDWLEKAVALNPTDTRSRIALSTHKWKGKVEILSSLVFPVLRETDNPAAKKKTAEQFLSVCQQFLAEGEGHLEDLRQGMKISAGSSSDIYTRLTSLLEEILQETAALLKASLEYDESIAGVFHTSLHYEEMKEKLKNIDLLKNSWEAEFTDASESPSNQTDPLDELNNMVGLLSVKNRVRDHYRYLSYQKKRKDLGYRTKETLNLNMIITGNPGTGKTTIARLLAKIYNRLGILPRADVIETDRSQLVGSFVGQTEENVRKAVESALGGVLFIDEAYSLKRAGQSGNDYGQTAIDTLVSLMTGNDYGGNFAVILAGYTEEMRQFLAANPGLRSRFPTSSHIHLPDYSDEELMQIGEQAAWDNDYVLTEGAREGLRQRIVLERVDETFGNARTVRSIIDDAVFKKGAESGNEPDLLSLSLLEQEDFSAPFPVQGGDPHAELEQLIGLKEIKEEVKSLFSFIRMQQYRRDRGLPEVPIQLHSVFTGNPGTGKTTVAKIYAELLKDCGILKRGHLIIGSRADFVAGYVGQTAGKTRKKIREALGGVLFIDEAYSLLSESEGDFGREVIETLVEEMTRHNENLVVVLAGYPAEMNILLESNPGLKSRFKKFFNFDDYSVGELLDIMETRAEQYQYTVSQRAKEFLVHSLSGAENHGNGRLAINIIDEAIQTQAFRLMENGEIGDFGKEAVILEDVDFKTALEKLGRGGK
ncbi:AAA family ATPase [Mesobacillus zeae]|uniref:AAA family ATPase n=1 Tax=Mesobacillus zeae TaxID=1917180 RepID=UPI00300A5DF3